MRYKFSTPYDDLSENLKKIVDADEFFDGDAWNNGDDKERWAIVEKCFKPTGLRGKLSEDELDYLEDCNMHTICRYFEGWTEADYLAYCKKRDAPPKWLVGLE